MENVSVELRTFSDGSKAYYLIFWQNEGEIFHALKIQTKQYHELVKNGFQKTYNSFT